jgi:hypothetical protein
VTDVSAADSRSRTRVRGADTFLLVTALVVAAIILVMSSHPAGPAGLAWLALPLLGLGTVCCWTAVAIHSAVRRRLPRALIIAPLVGLLTAGLVCTATPSRLRFILIDRPAFEAVVERTPAPIITLPDRDLTDEEADDTYDDFPGPCPTFIGTLHIQDCASFAAGYLFYDSAGSGFIDDGGLAYMPAGAPIHDVGNGAFESPQFWHLYGDWHAFASSW